MRVLHVMYSAVPEYGGPFTSLVGFVSAATSVGVETEVFSTDVGGTCDAGLVPGGVRYFPCFPRRGYPIAPGLLRSLLDSAAHADVVHIHGLWRFHTIAGAWAARSRGIPYILRTCGHLSPESFAYSTWQKRIYHGLVEARVIRNAERLHFTTDAEREASRWIAGDAPYAVLPPPVIGPERVEPAEARRRLGLAADQKLVVSVGRLVPIKNHPVLIAALAQLPRDVSIAIVGADERGHAEFLMARATEAGVADRVRLVGHVDRKGLGDWLSAADLFVSLSEHENFGVAIVEAAMVATPLLIPQDLAIAGVWHGSAAMLASREPAPVASAILEQLADDRRWERARKGREIACAHWSPQAIGAQLRDLYENARASTARRARDSEGPA